MAAEFYLEWEDDFEVFTSAETAVEDAENTLEQCRCSAASDGWPECIETNEVGIKISTYVTELFNRSKPEEEELAGWDEVFEVRWKETAFGALLRELDNIELMPEEINVESHGDLLNELQLGHAPLVNYKNKNAAFMAGYKAALLKLRKAIYTAENE